MVEVMAPMVVVVAKDHMVVEVVAVEWVVPKKTLVPICKHLIGIVSNLDHLRKNFMFLILPLKEGNVTILMSNIMNLVLISYFLC